MSLWQIYVLAAGLGFVNLFDNPARQTFVSEMVGMELLPNAVSLNSVLMNSARVIGPAIGGVLILTVGVATCFFINAASYAAVIVALAMMRAAELYRRPGVVRARGQVREGLRYVWSTPDLKIPLISMAIVGVFAFNFTVTLPLLAKFTFHGGAGLYSWFLVAMGAGAVVGGLVTAFRSRPSTRLLAFIGVVFGGAILAVALSPTQALGPGPARPDGCGQHLVRRHQQRHPAAAGRPRHAGPRHVAQRHRLPRQHADRGASRSATSATPPTRGWPWSIGGVATLVASIPLFVLGARQRRSGTEGLVMGPAVPPGRSNVVPLPLVAEAAYERPERRTS